MIFVRRTQIYLDEPMDEQLRQQAAAEGRSAAAVIREALGAYLGRSPTPSGEPDPSRAMAGAFHGLPRDAAVEHDRGIYGDEAVQPEMPPHW